MQNSTNLNSPHPYYPTEAQLMGYLANEWTVLTLLAFFVGTWTLILGITLAVVSRISPNLGKADKIAILWFILTGSIHVFFEGYFVVNHTRMASAQDLFGQLWKEYSLSDSRYLTSDTFVVCIETIAAVSFP